jgi:hypothetical protein
MIWRIAARPPTGTRHKAAPPWTLFVKEEGAMRPLDNTDWSSLELNCHRGEAQEAIGLAIREGTIRVVPAPNGRIRIIPVAASPASTSDELVRQVISEAYPTFEVPLRRARSTFAPIRRAPGAAVSGPRR